MIRKFESTFNRIAFNSSYVINLSRRVASEFKSRRCTLVSSLHQFRTRFTNDPGILGVFPVTRPMCYPSDGRYIIFSWFSENLKKNEVFRKKSRFLKSRFFPDISMFGFLNKNASIERVAHRTGHENNAQILTVTTIFLKVTIVCAVE